MPDVACISSHCRCNGPECCSSWLHWHPSCAMQHQRKNMRERERCNYPPLSLSLYFPQQQKEISCRNDSYQSKDGRFVSDSRSAAVSLFSSLSAVCVSEVMVVNTNTDIFWLKLRKHKMQSLFCVNMILICVFRYRWSFTRWCLQSVSNQLCIVVGPSLVTWTDCEQLASA